MLMWPLYFAGILLYEAAIRVASIFNDKAKLWVAGRKEQQPLWEALKGKNEKRILFHCASLGEFEQGRPVLEALRSEYPDHKIVLTFFSPSGYEVRKNTPLADYVFYLPMDGPVISRKFVKTISPKMIFFVKYEFWYFYGKYIAKKKIPYYCVSAIFRADQVFFKFYGGFFRKMLLRFTHLFVQDQNSLSLLYKQSIARVTVTGDTRFDRVIANAQHPLELSEIKSFVSDKKVIVAGSTWSQDEEIIKEFYQSIGEGFKLIIASHEIKQDNLMKLRDSFNGKAVLYSEWKSNASGNFQVLIIDNVGMLSSLYQFADYAYIGGGFGVGIHNILEAVVFGVPVFFGPNYKRFKEANDLIKLRGAFSIANATDLSQQFNLLELDESLYAKTKSINEKYIHDNKGATGLIMEYLRMNYEG
jgi:3-deoxy-D-manno-octulosonic-acid transferase